MVFNDTATAEIYTLSLHDALPISLAGERLRAIDPDVRVMSVAPFTQLLDRPLARPRFAASVLAVFAGGALLLATVGHWERQPLNTRYGHTSYPGFYLQTSELQSLQ